MENIVKFWFPPSPVPSCCTSLIDFSTFVGVCMCVCFSGGSSFNLSV